MLTVKYKKIFRDLEKEDPEALDLIKTTEKYKIVSEDVEAIKAVASTIEDDFVYSYSN